MNWLGRTGTVRVVTFLVVAAVVVVLVRLGLGIWQVNNHAICQSVVWRIEEYKEDNGQPPPSLDLVFEQVPTDAWGSRLFYEVRDGAYVLASHGLGGRPDPVDYWAFRERLKEEKRANTWSDHDFHICQSYTRDEIRTDLGWVQVCGK